MFIKSLELTNFKRFKHLKLDFPSDITVIKGPNEQGKSTVVQALIASLFYDSTKSPDYVKICKSWGCDKLYTIQLVFEADGEEYVLEKDFDKRKIVLKNQASLEVIDDYKEITKKLAQFGGYQTPELFFQTACVKQGELAILDRKETVQEALQDIISGVGAPVSLNSIFKRIQNAREELTRGLERGLVKNPGRILRLQNELRERAKELEEKQRVFREEDSLRTLLGKFHTERTNLAEQLTLKERALKDALVYFEVKKVLTGLCSEYQKLAKRAEQIEKIASERNSVAEKVADLKKFSEIDMRPFDMARRDMERIEIQREELSDQIAAMERKKIAVKEFVNARYLMTAAVLITLGFLGFFADSKFFLSWVLFGFFSFWLAFSKSVFSRITRKKLERRQNILRHDIEKIAAGLKEKLKKLHVGSIEEVEENRGLLLQIQNQIKVMDGKIEGLLGDETYERLNVQKRELVKRIGVEESKLEIYRGIQLPGMEERAALQRDTETFRNTLAELEKKIAGAETILARAMAPHEAIASLEEKIYSLTEELKRAESQSVALKVLDESLREAQQKAFGSTRKVLEQYISEFLAEITSGKYSRVSIGPQMKIRVFSPEKNEEIEPGNNLSRGSIEELYLVGRFALISLLYAGASRPLVILDDPFGNFDPERKARTRHILKNLSQKFQILFLTCSNEYDKWGMVVDLEETA